MRSISELIWSRQREPDLDDLIRHWEGPRTIPQRVVQVPVFKSCRVAECKGLGEVKLEGFCPMCWMNLQSWIRR